MEAVRTIRADRRVEGVDPGIARCTGQITVRFENTTLLAQAQAGTSAEFAMAFTIDANRSLTITLHEVYLALAKTPIEGPAGVEASFDFRAAFNATATRMMTAVLRNQQARPKSEDNAVWSGKKEMDLPYTRSFETNHCVNERPREGQLLLLRPVIANCYVPHPHGDDWQIRIQGMRCRLVHGIGN